AISIDKIVESIRKATNGRLDIVLITHEHEDHVNGFAATRDDGSDCWDGFKIDEVWLAWTEDGTDDDANKLRKRFDDTLLGLAAALTGRHGLNVDGDERLEMIEELLALHTGAEDMRALAASLTQQTSVMRLDGALAASIPGIRNKEAMQKMRHAAARRVRF